MTRKSSTVTAPIIAILFAIILYIGLSTKGSAEFEETPQMANYNMLARSLLDGHLSIGDIPPACLVEGSDVRDPGACPPPVFDVLAYDGKYFFLQEPLPVLFHIWSLIILGKPVPTGIVVLMLSCGCLLMFGLIISVIRKHFFPDSPKWLMQVALALFAFSGMQLYMVSRPLVYHETIVAAAFFLLLGTLFLLRGLFAAPNSGKWFVLAGVFLGASLASKISMIWYPVCFWTLYVTFQIRRKEPLGRLASNTIAFGFPVVCFFCLLLLYNYLRFGNPADFGRTHLVLPAMDLYKYCILGDNYLRLAHVPYNLATYFIKLPELVLRMVCPGCGFRSR